MSKVLLLLSLIVSRAIVLALDSIVIRDPGANTFAIPERRLSATKRSHDLGRRDVQGCLSHDHELHYLDSNTLDQSSQFGARISMAFKTPTLLLEDIEHHVETISCCTDSIYLRFHSREALVAAHKEFSSSQSFLLITSHEGCNKDGERDPHMVSESAVNVDERVIFLSVSRVDWKHTFESMKLDFGETQDRLDPHEPRELRARQAAASSIISGAATSTSIAYPATPSSEATDVNVTKTLNASYIDTEILPPSQQLDTIPVPELPVDMTVKCKNCTFYGTINLVAGSLSTGPFTNSNESPGIVNETNAILDYIDDGFLEFRANGLGAHVELDTAIEATQDLASWTVPLPPIPITPLLIPGIASVGPEFAPALTAGFQLKEKLEFSTGFEVTVPDNSSLILNLAERNGSSQQGFNDATVTSLPFQAQTPSIELTFAAGFQPRLLCSVDFFSGSASAGAGFFFTLPSLTTTLSTVTHVDSLCNPVNDTTPSSSIHDTLTHINTSVEVGAGVIAQAGIKILGTNHLRDEVTYEVLGKTFPLPTGCLAFDEKEMTYGVPAAMGTGVAPAEGTAMPSQSGTSGAASLWPGRYVGIGRQSNIALAAMCATGAVFTLF